MSDIVESIIGASSCSDKQRSEAKALYKHHKKGSDSLRTYMELVFEAKQFGDMGSFENWIYNAISAVKERSHLLDQIDKLKKENELLKQKPNQMTIEDILERLTKLERKMRMVRE